VTIGDTSSRATGLAVSVVIPVLNEEGNIAPLVKEISEALQDRWPFEVIYVDDGSSDRTAAEVERLAAAHSWLRQIRHTRTCGKAEALRTGVIATRAPIIVTLDGDCQNNPVFIPPMVETLRSGAPRMGLVAAQRIGRKDTGFKKIQSRIANKVRAAILRDGTRDTGCGLKAFDRELFLALPMFDGMHRFLPALVKREGREIGYVDVIDRPRLAGTSKYGMWNRLWVGILDLVGVWWLIRRKKNVPEIAED
jgi:dolichol-phosphate mannosyltransferase